MQTLTVNEYLLRTGINQEVTVHLLNGSVLKTILLGVNQEELYVKDEIGLPTSIKLGNVKTISFNVSNDYYSLGIKEKKELSTFVRIKTQLGHDAKYDPFTVFPDELDRLRHLFKESALSDYFSVNRISSIYIDDVGIKEAFSSLLRTEKSTDKDKITVFVGKILILLMGRKYSEVSKICMDMLDNPNSTISKGTIYKTLSFIAGILKDDDQSFYWLDKYFQLHHSDISENDNLWWKYLEQAVEFSSYSTCKKIFLDRQVDRTLVTRSLSYIFANNNEYIRAYRILHFHSYDTELDYINSFSSVLSDDYDNKYHRFVRCIEDLFNNKNYMPYVNNNSLEGYVFDYIPTKSYGYILGFDCMKYYFHIEETNEAAIRMIKKEICSLKSVDEERLCVVHFDRIAEGKRIYQAVNVQ